MAEEIDNYEAAKAMVVSKGRPSASWLQRKLGIGYNTAAKLIERMEADGIVSGPDHVGRRTVLLPQDDANYAALVAMAEELWTKGARVGTAADGTTQLMIPIDLPEEHRATDDRLRLLIERIERLEEEKKGTAEDIRDCYAEAKAVGYDAKIMRQIVRLRKMKPDDRSEMEMILEAYKCALGLG